MDEALAGHLVDQRDRAAQRVLDLRRIPFVDRRADVAERAAEPGAHLPVVFAPDDVLAMRFQSGIVTGHLK